MYDSGNADLDSECTVSVKIILTSEDGSPRNVLNDLAYEVCAAN